MAGELTKRYLSECGLDITRPDYLAAANGELQRILAKNKDCALQACGALAVGEYYNPGLCLGSLHLYDDHNKPAMPRVTAMVDYRERLLDGLMTEQQREELLYGDIPDDGLYHLLFGMFDTWRTHALAGNKRQHAVPRQVARLFALPDTNLGTVAWIGGEHTSNARDKVTRLKRVLHQSGDYFGRYVRDVFTERYSADQNYPLYVAMAAFRRTYYSMDGPVKVQPRLPEVIEIHEVQSEPPKLAASSQVKAHALCLQLPHEFRLGEGHAKALCARCKVKDLCLDDALANPTRPGVRGGLTAPERRMRQLRATIPK